MLFFPAQATYYTINESSVRELKVLSAPPARAPEAPEASLPPPNTALAAEREARAVTKAAAEGQNVCPSATAHAQSVFNELSKTMTVAWMLKEPQPPCILVMESVLISSPYTTENLKAATDRDGARLKERITKVLAGILRKLPGAAGA